MTGAKGSRGTGEQVIDGGVTIEDDAENVSEQSNVESKATVAPSSSGTALRWGAGIAGAGLAAAFIWFNINGDLKRTVVKLTGEAAPATTELAAEAARGMAPVTSEGVALLSPGVSEEQSNEAVADTRSDRAVTPASPARSGSEAEVTAASGGSAMRQAQDDAASGDAAAVLQDGVAESGQEAVVVDGTLARDESVRSASSSGPRAAGNGTLPVFADPAYYGQLGGVMAQVMNPFTYPRVMGEFMQAFFHAWQFPAAPTGS